MSLFCCRDVHALAGLMVTGIYFYEVHIHTQVGAHLLPSGHPVDASWTMFSFFVVLPCAQGSFKSQVVSNLHLLASPFDQPLLFCLRKWAFLNWR